MTSSEMHVYFRQYAQQMGMQNARGILPEQIDVLINSSISDTINTIVRENTALSANSNVTDNAKIGQINALRTLYTNNNFTIGVSGGSGAVPDIILDANSPMGLFKSERELFKSPTSEDSYMIDALFLSDITIDYNRGGKLTSEYTVRIIDGSKLADSIHDYILRPTVDSPIATVVNNVLWLYLGEAYTSGNRKLSTVGLTPNVLHIRYVKKPAKVHFATDATNVDCDLPESLHVDIVKHAVDLYNTSVLGNPYVNQQQQISANREQSRNQARSENNQ